MISGVSTSLDGVRWGDGWSAVQSMNLGEAATAASCSGGEAGCAESCGETQHGSDGGCRECSMPLNCADVVASPARDSCACVLCAPGWMRRLYENGTEACDARADEAASAAHGGA